MKQEYLTGLTLTSVPPVEPLFSLSFSLSFFGLLVVVAVLGVEAGSSPSERSSFGDSPANGNGS